MGNDTELCHKKQKAATNYDSQASQKKCLEFFQCLQAKKPRAKLPDFFKEGIKLAVHKCFGGDFEHWKPLLVYLNNENSSFKFTFALHSMSKAEVLDFIHNNFVPVCFDITEKETRDEAFQTIQSEIPSAAAVLSKVNIESCPSVVVVRKNGPHFQVTSYACEQMCDNFLEVISQARDLQEVSKDSMRNQLIRDEQRKAYEDSLKKDQEKSRKVLELQKEKELEDLQKKKEMEDLQKKKEMEDLQKKREMEDFQKKKEMEAEIAKSDDEKRLKQMEEYSSKLKEEPSAENKEAYIVKIQVPDGSELERRFSKFDTLQSLVDFVAAKGFLIGKFAIWRLFPKENISGKCIT